MNRLNYHHLYYFWRVATVGNLTRVARELHISQSALSVQIKQLEHTMSVSLFERKGRSLKLTDMGKRVQAYAEDIFTKGEELESFLTKGVLSEIQHLTIGVLQTLSRNFVESFISSLLSKPEVSFSLTSGRMADLLASLENHELDLILTNRPALADSANDLWTTQLVSQQPLAIVGPAEGKIPTPFPEGYEQVQWVLPGKASGIRDAFNSLCACWQYHPDIKAEADDMAMLRLLARDSNALTVLPPVVVKDEIKQGILAEYQQLPDACEHFYAITAQRKFIPPLLLDLLS